MKFAVTGNIVDISRNLIFPGEVVVEEGWIKMIRETEDIQSEHYILPGFIDSHVHIESSMLIPQEFARLAVVHGTVGTVSDPHEIANVCGIDGVDFMIENGKTVPFHFYFGAPSCVPATAFETAGAALNSHAVEQLLKREEITYLSEMMNFPGVLHGDDEVMKKITAAKKLGKPVDGHAPGLRGEQARKYIAAGISTDHECFTAEEALDKLAKGMKILVREGSAAKNFEALALLLNEHSENMMFCSDDKHPDSLVSGHINQLCARAVAKGINVFKVLQAACINPVKHYNMNIGLMKVGDAADFIVVKDLEKFEVLQTYIKGNLVAENGSSKIFPKPAPQPINHFDCRKKSPEDFQYSSAGSKKKVAVIEALDGELITKRVEAELSVVNGCVQPDTDKDILEIVVVNRYKDAPVAKAFIRNFGLKRGAIASTVAHDSHNIVAVGADDGSICNAVNLVIEAKGGVSLVDSDHEMLLALPVAGLMSAEDGFEVARQYSAIDKAAKALGSKLGSPYMTLSFMALLVIPELKLSDRGLFDGTNFQLVNSEIPL